MIDDDDDLGELEDELDQINDALANIGGSLEVLRLRQKNIVRKQERLEKRIKALEDSIFVIGGN